MADLPEKQGDNPIAIQKFLSRFAEAVRSGSIPLHVAEKICGGEGDLMSVLDIPGKDASEGYGHVVDLSAEPFVPEPIWGNEKEKAKYAVSVAYHAKERPRKFDLGEIAVVRLNESGEIDPVYGSTLQRLAWSGDRKPYNANMLDFLLENPNLIPERLKGITVCFNGTVYRDIVGSFVRTLAWCGFRWLWGWCRIENGDWKNLWHGNCYAAVHSLVNA